jgi:hypothetical protein
MKRFLKIELMMQKLQNINLMQILGDLLGPPQRDKDTSVIS